MVAASQPSVGIGLFESSFHVPRIYQTLVPIPSLYLSPFGAPPVAGPFGFSPWRRPSVRWPADVFTGIVEAPNTPDVAREPQKRDPSRHITIVLVEHPDPSGHRWQLALELLLEAGLRNTHTPDTP